MGEMAERPARIGEKTQSDPAGHEVKFGTVIGVGRNRGRAHDSVGGLCVAEINKLAGERSTFAPPFIGILVLQTFRLSRDDQLGRGCGVVVLQQPVNPAQRIAQILACFFGYGIEQRLALRGVRRRSRTSLYDRDLIAAEPLGGAHRRFEVLGADASVHTRRIVGRGQHAVERAERRGFHACRKLEGPPY